MEQGPSEEEREADRLFWGATAVLIFGVGVTGMGAFLLVQQLTGGQLVLNKGNGTYLSRWEAVELALGMILGGGIAWWLGLRWTDRNRR